MKNNSIGDYLVCPVCGNDMYVVGTDELEFGLENEGHYRAYCWCSHCKEDKEFFMGFKYEITSFHMYE